MPVKRGHVVHQNSFLECIIRKFDDMSEFQRIEYFLFCFKRLFRSSDVPNYSLSGDLHLL